MNEFDVRTADVWWACLPPERKCQIHRWIEPGAQIVPPTEGQYALPIAEPTDIDDAKEARQQ